MTGFSEFVTVWKRVFQDREVIIRGRGRIHYIVLSSRIQQLCAFVGLGLFVWTAMTTFSFISDNQLIASKSEEADRARSKAETLAEDFRALNSSYKATTDELIENHRLFENLVIEHKLIETSTVPGKTPQNEPAPSDKSASAEEVSRSVEQLKQNQLALVEAIDERAIKDTERLIAAVAMTGLDVQGYLSAIGEEGAAQGGPLLLSSDAGPVLLENGNKEPNAFKRAYFRTANNLSRLADLRSAINQLPLITPVVNPEDFYVSSSYGRRRDPITSQAAFHAGIDLGGHRKTPIHSTAAGVVVAANVNGPYGNLVEVDHGHGLKTRYGHLHTISVKIGDEIEAGDIVGTMGSSGRTTGTHVHYEIWYNRQTMDPAKFLKAGKHVQQDRQI